MKNIILNSSHIVAGSNNSEFEYAFPSSITFRKGDKVSLAFISQYYSNFNINNSLYGNASFSYKWFDGITYPVDMPNGYYTYENINDYIHFTMVKNKHYMTDSNGNYVYFINLSINQSKYAIQVDIYELSTSIATNSGWIIPSGVSWSIPTSSKYCQFVVSSSGFGKVVGYPNASYPSSQTGYTGTQSFLSSFTPEISPVSSYLLTCSLVNNKISIPSSLLYSYTSRNSDFGQLFEVNPSLPLFVNVQEGSYNTMRIKIYDQNLRPIRFEDSQTTIMIYLLDGDDK